MPLVGDTYGLGEPIEITVTFDTAVTVDTSGGTPRIELLLGSGNKWAEYSSGSGGTALEFTYDVQSGDMDDDGISIEADRLQLRGGTITAAADNAVNAFVYYDALGVQPDHKVDGGPTTSDDATLSALALSGVTLDPTFVSSTETYTATVGNAVTETTVTATPTDSGATVAFKDGDNNTLTSPVSLAVGANVIKAEVTAEDTTTTKTYMVTVTREAAAGTCLAPTFTGRAEVWRGTITVGNDAFSRGYEDNRFGDLSDPDNFDYGGTNYTIAGIRESFDTGSVNRLELDLDAFLPDSDQDKLRLHLCGDTFDLTTATQAGTSTYRWTDAVLDWSGATTIEAALSGSPPAIVTDGVQVTSTPDTPDTYGLGETIAITVTFDTAVTVDTSGGTPRIRFVLNGGVNPVRVWAEYSSGSGGTALVFTYTVQAGDLDDDGIWLPADFLELQSGTIRDAAYPTVAATLTYAQPGTQSEHKVDGGPTTSDDATLSALALSGVTLAPTFVSATEDYTATVVNAVTETTVTATPTHSGATVAFKDGDDNALTNPVTLAVGANVIKAVVTAEDTTTMKTYMVTVTRAGTTTTAPEIVNGGVQVTSSLNLGADGHGRHLRAGRDHRNHGHLRQPGHGGHVRRHAPDPVPPRPAAR